MKKKVIRELRKLDIKELIQKAESLRKEIAHLKLEFAVNKPKDTNIILKKRKELAAILTIIGEKKEQGNEK